MIMCSLFTTSLFSKADKKLVEEYLKVSGAQEIILALPQQIERGYVKSIKDEKLKNIDIKSSFDSKTSIEYTKIKLSEEFSNNLLKNVIAYYKSPLGMKYKDRAIKSMKEKDLKNRLQYLSEIKKNPPSYQRINIMNAFVDRLELTPVAVHLIGELLGSINAKLITSQDRDKVLRDVSNQIRESMLINSLYAYSSFSEKELKAVMDYYYTNAGRFEQIIVSGVFKQLIMESFSQIMEQNQIKFANAK
jgi:hypothetical protein